MTTTNTTRRIALALTIGTVSALALVGCSGSGDDDSGPITLTITANAITGGKNAAEADWYTSYVIPGFEAEMKKQGKDVTVEFEPQGVDDEDYKTKIALDLQSGEGADIIGMDGIWVGEFADAGYIKPLSEVGGDAVDSWDGWAEIPDAVQGALSYNGDRYGVPQGADGRVLFYNKHLFSQAGLPEDWQPTSWDDILDACRALKELDGVTPIQLNAGTAMGEATTMQGLLPLLAGTGDQVYQDGTWLGDSAGLESALNLYKTIYVDEGLGDPVLQQEASGRDTSFQLFAENKIGILLEGDYFWRSVVNPAEGVGTAPMENRDEVVGYAKIPAETAGSGINGQDFVSMSGGTGRVLNPNSEHADLAWELLAYMNSADAYVARTADAVAITPRTDVNETILADDPMLSFVNDEVLPITTYRPGLAEYPQVSVLLQQATLDVVTGTSVDDAIETYDEGLEDIVGSDAVTK
ncbi:MAG: extracellular solute-binding protein [Microbacterium sp.]